ncbi:THUMP domain-containing protein 2 [Chanos chanos]|uniref:THUMP domain-containing protein 2 n=1 Tax=Chanos chanos TaxID=29144 RepID=A0A6J2WD06_CHACN|nr:THUMP domain-containing protein 2 [Chanos chanos]
MGEEYDCIRYYCTAGSGMEPFLVEEVKSKLSATDVDHISGRVFFSTCAPLEHVTKLKSAERLFLLIRRDPPISLPKFAARTISKIQRSIIGDLNSWIHTLSIWSRLVEELKPVSGRGQKRKREEEDETRVNDKSLRNEETLLGQTSPTFRVNCRCSGAVMCSFTSQDFSRIIGTAIRRQLGWKVDLREPDLEVNVSINDDHCILGIPLLKCSLASRSYIKHSGLRSTVAWTMASLCSIQEGCVILDPMCGVGTVLLEAAQECSSTLFIGMDCSAAQLLKAAENVETAGLGGRVELLQSSAMEIPLPSNSVDGVICDVPFGRKFSCGTNVTVALPKLIREMERVLSVNGSLVLLLSLQLSALLKKLLSPDRCLLATDPLTNKNTSNIDSSDTHTNTCRPDTDTHSNKHSSEGDIQLSPCTLQLQSIYRVSLGNTDGLIHKYLKTMYGHTATKAHTHKDIDIQK